MLTRTCLYTCLRAQAYEERESRLAEELAARAEVELRLREEAEARKKEEAEARRWGCLMMGLPDDGAA